MECVWWKVWNLGSSKLWVEVLIFTCMCVTDLQKPGITADFMFLHFCVLGTVHT